MAGWQIALIVLFFLVIDLAIVGAVMRGAVQMVFEPLTKDFPPQTPSPDVLLKEFQSVEKDRMNMGWCVHMGADALFLHLFPAWLPRVFGAKPASVPWDVIRVEKVGVFGSRVVIGTIKGSYAVPKWVAKLAGAGVEDERAGP